MNRVFLIAALALALTGCGDGEPPPVYSLSQEGQAMRYIDGTQQGQICMDGVVYVRIYTGNVTSFTAKFGTDSKVILCGIPPKPALPEPVPAPPKPAPAPMVI